MRECFGGEPVVSRGGASLMNNVGELFSARKDQPQSEGSGRLNFCQAVV